MEITKSKICHSYEAHTYLRHIGFARWFQRIESLYGGNWANGPSVRDKCPFPISPWLRTQHINVWRMVGGNMPTLTCLWLTVRVRYNVETKSRTYMGPYRTCWMFSQYCWSHEHWATVQLMGAINALQPYNCTKRSPLTFPAVTCSTFHLWTWEKYANVRQH